MGLRDDRMSELARVRRDRRLTVKQLASEANLSPQQVRNIEAGRTARPREETLWSLADVLGVEWSVIDPCVERTAA